MEKAVRLDIDGVSLEGTLGLPEDGDRLVLFAHGSGSSRLSPRNTYVARVLQEAGIGTLLFDLLTGHEDTVYERRFDIGLLARRLAEATKWVTETAGIRGASIGYFGASTGAAAALQAASGMGTAIRAVVSRGGRPDLALPYLGKVSAATLLIVGQLDVQVLQLNQQALEALGAEKKLAIVPGATHLFSEPGTLEQAAKLAREWFVRHL